MPKFQLLPRLNQGVGVILNVSSQKFASTGCVSILALYLVLVHHLQSALLKIIAHYVDVHLALLVIHLSTATKVRIDQLFK